MRWVAALTQDLPRSTLNWLLKTSGLELSQALSLLLLTLPKAGSSMALPFFF
jgi:hypothetical protein